MFHVEVNLIYICYLVNLVVFLMRPSGDQPDVPCGPRGEKFSQPELSASHSSSYVKHKLCLDDNYHFPGFFFWFFFALLERETD